MSYTTICLFVAIWIHLCLNFYVSGDLAVCNSVEEGSDAKLYITLNTIITSYPLSVYLHNQEVCSCQINALNCIQFSEKISTLLEKSTDLVYNLTVVKTNMSRNVNEDGVWTIKYFKDVSRLHEKKCYFQYFVKAHEIQCTSLSQEDIYVSCSTSKIYPEINCLFSITNPQSSNVALKSIDTTNTEIDDGLYYSSTCMIFQPIKFNSLGTYNVIASIYPNISENTNDAIYGTTNKSLTIIFEKPYIALKGCPSQTEVGEEFHCECSLKGFGSANAVYSWYNASDNVLITNTSTLTLKGNTFNKEFYCKANSVKLPHSILAYLNITIIENEIQIKLETNGVENSTVVLRKPTSLEVVCKTNVSASMTIQMIKEGKMLILNRTAGPVIMWIKNSASGEDSGLYQCFLSTNEKMYHSEVNIIIQVNEKCIKIFETIADSIKLK